MRSNYKALGGYIREVNERDTDQKVTLLLGVSIQKVFMPSIANTIGTDMSTYKIVRRNQFAYGPVTSRNGDKISIALLDNNDAAIVSQAYTTFEIIDSNQLHPQYLMMWFRRPEFDRYARFKSHGSAREIFDWNELCNTQLPIPSIEKQREIVAEYNTVKNRIELNNRLIQKLEETAQAIYKQWFVDFEFPDENGKPYRSSGGKMVYNEELEKEIPVGWEKNCLLNYTTLSQGIQVEVENQFLNKTEGMKRFIRIIDYTPNTEELPRYVKINESKYYCLRDEISMIRYGDAGTVCRRIEGVIANNLFKITPINGLTNNYIYYLLKDENVQQEIRTSAASSTMPAITHSAIKDLDVVVPEKSLIIKFDRMIQPIEDAILNLSDENIKLKALVVLLLSRLTTIEY